MSMSYDWNVAGEVDWDNHPDDKNNFDCTSWTTSELRAAANDIEESLEAMGGRSQTDRPMGLDEQNDWLEMTIKLAEISAELWRRCQPPNKSLYANCYPLGF